MSKLFKLEVHEGEDYFRFSELCTTNDDEKYYIEVDKKTGRLLLKQLELIKSFIRNK